MRGFISVRMISFFLFSSSEFSILFFPYVDVFKAVMVGKIYSITIVI